jgi:uncharacterized protein YceK
MRHYLVGLLFLTVVLSGCASTPSAAKPGTGDTPTTTAPPSESKPASAGEPSVLMRIVLFLPDRILDALDLVSFGAGVGAGMDINVHITRYLHFFAIGAYGTANPINWNYSRNLSALLAVENEIGIGPLVTGSAAFVGIGTGWDKGGPGSGSKSYQKTGIVSLSDPMYGDGYRDAWGIGVGVGPILLGPRAEAEIHPVEIVDLVAGLLTLGLVDISEDDFATRLYR